MTQFSQVELIYNQFLNLTNEIDELVKKEEYANAAVKVEHKDRLIKKLSAVKKTVKFKDEEKLKMQSFEKTIKEKNDIMLANLIELRKQTSDEVNKNKKKIKLNAAYEPNQPNLQGGIVDISE